MNCVRVILFFSMAIVFPAKAEAQLRLAKVFGDNMVLQREMPVPIWGWSDPGDKIAVKANGLAINVVADAKGKWKVTLSPMALGSPFSMTVSGTKNKIVIQNIVMGEVWICSGQSNMAWNVDRAANPDQERQAANFPNIRHLKVQIATAANPEDEFSTTGWEVCSPETVGMFTAVGYYFGRELHQQLDVPIGLINTTWGGTMVEAWTSGKTLAQNSDLKKRVAEISQSSKPSLAEKQQFKNRMASYRSTLEKLLCENDDFAAEQFEDDDWNSIKVPGSWESQDQGEFDGAAWYRKQVTLPESWVGKDLELSLANIDDQDRAFVNGNLIGQNKQWNIQRKYSVPGSMND
ncbi:MAG: sialate O-acetylesterase, partial [Planctomycetota bacterium]